MSQYFISASRTYTEKPNVDLFKMHTHENYEIFCFISGKAKYYVEGTEYILNPYDILIMKKAEAHSLLLLKDVPYERIVINFDASAIVGENANKIIDFLNNRPLGKKNLFPFSRFKEKHWIYYLEKIYTSEDPAMQQIYLTVLLNELYSAFPDITYSNNAIEGNITEIIEYINRNLSSDIRLESICNHFHVSESHTNRKFKQITGRTIWNYITTKRLLLAKELLLNGNNPTKVYLQCGYNDYCSFYKGYKEKFNRSPKEDYKKLM